MENERESLKETESGLVYSVMHELGKYGAVYRTNSGSIGLSNGKYFRGLPKGFADIMLIRHDGKVCFVELKIKGNKPMPEQLAFIEKMRVHNCLAGVAYSVAEALAICELEAAQSI